MRMLLLLLPLSQLCHIFILLVRSYKRANTYIFLSSLFIVKKTSTAKNHITTTITLTGEKMIQASLKCHWCCCVHNYPPRFYTQALIYTYALIHHIFHSMVPFFYLFLLFLLLYYYKTRPIRVTLYTFRGCPPFRVNSSFFGQ